MRITGGKYVRRQIACPKGIIRPAMDRMRESLFAILGDLTGCSFLDLFSGSGIMAVEAAGRGANPVTVVEKDPIKKKVLYQNLSIIEETRFIRMMSVDRFLATDSGCYDVVYLDPPFPLAGSFSSGRSAFGANRPVAFVRRKKVRTQPSVFLPLRG